MYKIIQVITQSMHADTTKVNRDKTGVLTCGCTGEVQCSKGHSIFHPSWITDIDLLVQQWRRQTRYVCALTRKITALVEVSRK